MFDSASTRAFVVFMGLVGPLAAVIGVIATIHSIDEGEYGFMAIGLVGAIGFPLTVAGLIITSRCPYHWGRALGRTAVAGGTLCVAGLAGCMWWTIVGPVIALVIIAFWVGRLRRHWMANPHTARLAPFVG